MGMTEPARTEATGLWQELRKQTTGPNGLGENSATMRECRALIYESLGDDRRAAEIYAGRLEQQVMWLPVDLKPDAIATLREWWVGRAYAKCLGRSGQMDSTMAILQRKLDRPSEDLANLGERRANRILLAFLLEARGERDRAEVQWSALTAGPALALGR